MLDASVAYNGHLAVSYLNSGVVPKREGNANPIAAPSDVFACADGHLIIAAGNDRQFESLCEAIEMPHLIKDARFINSQQRIENREVLSEQLAQRILQHGKTHWL